MKRALKNGGVTTSQDDYAEKYFDAIDTKVKGEPLKALNSDSVFKPLLDDTETARSEHIKLINDFLLARFPYEVSDELDIQTQITNLTQKKDEAISSYYNRASNLLTKIGAKDAARNHEYTLSILESTTVKNIMKAFGNGLFDLELRQQVTGSIEWFSCSQRYEGVLEGEAFERR